MPFEALRMVSGVAPLSTTRSLLHFDGTDGSTTLTDVDGHAWATVGTAALDTSQVKFGTASCEFPGSGANYIRTTSTNPVFNFDTGDFTFEHWLFLPSAGNGNYRSLFDQRGSNVGMTLRVTDSQLLQAFYGDGSGEFNSGASSIANDSWVHIAITRASGTARIFIAGIKVGETSWSGVNLNRTGGINTNIGYSASDGSFPMIGWIDEIRITKGTALYTADFTPPASPFPD